MLRGRTHIIASKDTNNLAATIQLNEKTLVEILLRISIFATSKDTDENDRTHFLQLRLSLRHGGREVLLDVQRNCCCCLMQCEIATVRLNIGGGIRM